MLKALFLLIVLSSAQLYADCGTRQLLSIEQVQGSAEVSPWVGKKVVVEGVVTASYQAEDQLSGFFIQQKDVRTDQSHGLFIFSRKAVRVGEHLVLGGRVKEFHHLTELVDVEIIERCGTAPLPSASKLSWSMTQEQLEALEGVRVLLPESVLVDQYHLVRFGQLTVAQKRLMAQDQNAFKIIVDDASSVSFPAVVPYATSLFDQEPLRLGSRFRPITGVLHFSFGEYRIIPDTNLRVAEVNERPTAPFKSKNSIRLVSANVENFFNGNGFGQGFPTPRGAATYMGYQRQSAKVVAGLSALKADLYLLTELENDGFDAQSSVADLVEQLNKANRDARYQAVFFTNKQLGRDAIRNAMIVNRNSLVAVGEPRSIAEDLAEHWPDKLHRPSLLQRFEDKNGRRFTVVVNHFKSKGSACKQDTDESVAAYGRCHAERVDAAKLVTQWVEEKSSKGEAVFLMGDFNSYAHEPPIAVFEAAGYDSVFSDSAQYSYVYRGRAGLLDNILRNTLAGAMIQQSGIWHINADENPHLDYRVEKDSTLPWLIKKGTGPERFSDHDPLYVDLSL